MIIRRRVWLVVVVAILVFASANAAWRLKPPSTLTDRSRARVSATLAAGVPRDTWTWRIVMDFRRGPSAVRWVLHEGAQPGSGYEIHWQPDRLTFHIAIAGDQTRLLAAVAVDHGPRLVEVRRRGPRLGLVVDGKEVLSVIDALPAPMARTWGFQAAADLGEVVLSLYDDRRWSSDTDRILISDERDDLRAIADDPQWFATPTQALARLRLAMLVEPENGLAWDQAQRDARAALRALGDHHPDAASIDVWLAWNRLRGALRRHLSEPERLTAAIDLFVERGRFTQAPHELPGLLLDHMVRLAVHVQQRPARSTPPHEILDLRRVLLHGIGRLGMAALDLEVAGPAVTVAGERSGWLLRLAVHAAACLSGEVGQPTPAQGLGWLADRWRIFAGLAPRAGHLPTIESGWIERDPLTPLVEALLASARFEPFAAMALQERVRDALAAGDGATALAAVAAAPPAIAREAALTKAILAIRGIGTVEAARTALRRGVDADNVPWAEEDPLAFACDRLLELGSRLPQGDRGLILPSLLLDLPQPLRWADSLLNGRATAPAEAWRLVPERPFEALAAAMIMQEVAGVAPDWALLAGVPHFTVPLALLVPPPPPDAESVGPLPLSALPPIVP